MFCWKCGAENKEGSNYCSKCGAYLSSGRTKPEMVVSQISVAYPEAEALHLKIRAGGCRFKIKPGDGMEWVSGTYEYPSGMRATKIDRKGGTVKLTQEHDVGDLGGYFSGVPQFELTLGKTRPYMLTLEIGASESSFDLGGLPINHLVIKQGAGKVDFDFSAPNPQAMTSLDLTAGAVNMEMKNLANANFSDMIVDGGAASYKFDFGGVLQRNAQVKITAGVSSVEIHVPSSTSARIVSKTTLGGLDIGDGFTKKEGAFSTEAALARKDPMLAIFASVTLGSLILRTK